MTEQEAQAQLDKAEQAAKVYYKDELAGWLWVDEKGYFFVYDEAYLSLDEVRPISLSMPLQSEGYTDSKLFPFFDNLIPEGWLLDIALDNWKLSANDRFELLLATGAKTIGAVSIEPYQKSKDA